MANRRITYTTRGTCSQLIEVELDENDVIRDVVFIGGCNGNLQGIRQLVVGMKAEDVKQRLDGIRCGYKSTSCPDQLCRAIEQAQKN
ncbi:MAG: TIGR03905 family TSCPD domain-containing protein [Prevotella sp.]|nr:TIGR03905 family TSCPD domain-containing protein [Prevotella sp.]